MNENYRFEADQTSLLLYLKRAFFFVFVFVFSCSAPKVKENLTPDQKTMGGKNKNNGSEDKRSDVSEIAAAAPESLEKVSFIPLNESPPPHQIIPTPNYLWLIFTDRIEVISSLGKNEIKYESLEKTSEYTPLLTIYGRPFGLVRPTNSPRGIWYFDSKITLLFDSNHLYHFKEDGTFINRKRTSKKWWELKQGEYARYNWSIEYEYGYLAKLRFGHRKFRKGKKKIHRIPRKKISVDDFAFSGPWVLVTQRDLKHPKQYKKLVLLDRRTSEKVAEFKHWEAEREEDTRYDFRVHEKGFYIDRHEYLKSSGEYIVTPVKWFGEKVIALDHGPDIFCYAFEEQKKCIDNTSHKLRNAVEMEKYRVFQTEKNFYLEGFETKKRGREGL